MSAPVVVDLEALEAEIAQAFPGPWKVGRSQESVISPLLDETISNADAETHSGYGGALVCESAWKSKGAIVALHTAAPDMIAEIRRLREALRPFAEQCGPFVEPDGSPSPDDTFFGYRGIQVGHFRAARRALGLEGD